MSLREARRQAFSDVCHQGPARSPAALSAITRIRAHAIMIASQATRTTQLPPCLKAFTSPVTPAASRLLLGPSQRARES
jgi:hypothetical protein